MKGLALEFSSSDHKCQKFRSTCTTEMCTLEKLEDVHDISENSGGNASGVHCTLMTNGLVGILRKEGWFVSSVTFTKWKIRISSERCDRN